MGELTLAIANISMVGFRLNARAVIGRGERLMVQLPEYGRLEAFCIWTRSQQAGFMFERPIPRDKFELVVASMKAANLPSIVSGAKP